MNANQAKDILQYWSDLAECTCAEQRPIGGCEKCELRDVAQFIDEQADKLNSLS
jgi:hypothetical protein